MYAIRSYYAYRVAMRITGRHEDALDVVQDGFIKAFERLGEFQREASFKTWLLRITVNSAKSLGRKQGRKREVAITIVDSMVV